jgi:hypothetical protein
MVIGITDMGKAGEDRDLLGEAMLMLIGRQIWITIDCENTAEVN